ncbi:hypothetical protein ASE86_01070 [Sphingomonas sp. Leaf33]|uniref:hypothetical protein n=1 Tax=Sphingomonas sp. Leaf33 TaxID=1736215 RepID=UPI0006FF6AE1|nr:hypothetical protein [Sphingomonas sp. Leaf33]KQN24910.1 hypothetical protein ASE86_01070 [Sphingomonas sp. Leaf33]
MTNAAADNLTGRWHGRYTYVEDGWSNDFAAELHDVGGVLAGETREASDQPDDLHPEQTAFITGSHVGSSVTFIKRYDEMHRDAVFYDGTVDADGDEIFGRWNIGEDLSGTFIMIRPLAEEVEQREAIAAPIA